MLLVLAALPLTAAPAPAAAADRLVQLRPDAACRVGSTLAAQGGRLIGPELRVWRVPASARVPGWAVRRSEPVRPYGTLATFDFEDPFVPEQWWRAKVGADRATPPGPGRPVTVVDSGLDLAHPEFAGRPNVVPLNEQRPEGRDSLHGTAVASLVGAAVNGVGMVGVYPEAVLQSFDAAPGNVLDTGEIVNGVLVAARRGPSVINLSLGNRTRDTIVEQAVNEAFRRGSLVIAASGNDRGDGNPLQYPASLPHVLTVASTDRNDAPASFSSSSRFVDLAAPGVDMLVAVPVRNGGTGYVRTASGTSFSAPIVAGAAAWVWTVRPDLDNSQLFEVLRRSARDVGPPGFDQDTGFGVLDIPNALAYPAPIRDPYEPNEDIELVRPFGFFGAGSPPLTNPARPRATLAARLDRTEDPRDVYRVYLPPRKQVTVRVRANADVDLAAWGPDSLTVLGAPRFGRLAAAAKPGVGRETMVVRSTVRRGTTIFVDVALGRRPQAATYSLEIATAPVPVKKRAARPARR